MSALERIRAELCRGGRPVQAYFDADAARTLDRLEAASVTSAIVLNIEDRLVAIEQWIDNQGGRTNMRAGDTTTEARLLRFLHEQTALFFRRETDYDTAHLSYKGDDGFAVDADRFGRGDLYVVMVAHVETRQMEAADQGPLYAGPQEPQA